MQQLQARLALYLPLLILSILAMGSWWLMRSISTPQANTPNEQTHHEMDYQLQGFKTLIYNAQGQVAQSIEGQRAKHYINPDRVYIDSIQIEVIQASGAIIQAHANQGVIEQKGDKVTLLGSVQIQRLGSSTAPPMMLQGSRVVFIRPTEEILSSDPVKIWRDKDWVQAQSMSFNGQDGRYVLKGRVRGILHPTPEP